MRIAHINDIAGVAWRLAEAQRRLGHEATVIVLREPPFGFHYDLLWRGGEGPLGSNAVMLRHWRELSEFDVIHVHGGIWRSQLFYPIFKRRYGWKVLAVHFHGSEARTGKGLHHLGNADVQFHSTPDLAQLLPKSIWIPNPVDMPPQPPEPDNARTRFAHFPSRLAQKGTERIVELFGLAFGPLETQPGKGMSKLLGKDAELWVVTDVPHDEALTIMVGSDAIIDQMSPYQAYGMVAIEAMAYGKPVFSTIRQDWFPGCPIIPLQTDRDREALVDVARDSSLRRQKGKQGREYVARVHESGKVARQVMKAYYLASSRPAFTAGEAASFWRRRGHTYVDEFSSPETRQRFDSQSAELMDVLGGLEFRSIAEIGCGFGRIGSEVVKRFGGSWVGADLSRGQLVAARQRDVRLGGRLVEASATSLPLRGGSSDLVLAVELLLHIPPEQIQAALREMLRVSRRYVVHLDWYEDYLSGYRSGWCWAHDYPALWRSLGFVPREVRVRSTGIQRIFVIKKPG